MMFPVELIQAVERLSRRLRTSGLTIVAAESCTGGLIAGLFTEIPGSSAIFERGFVTYTNLAKSEMLGVPASSIEQFGAVSQPVAVAMAVGALAHSAGDIAVAVTGVAGPDGGSEAKPVGLVHVAVARGTKTMHRECRFGSVGRNRIRLETIAVALEMLDAVLVE